MTSKLMQGRDVLVSFATEVHGFEKIPLQTCMRINLTNRISTIIVECIYDREDELQKELLTHAFSHIPCALKIGSEDASSEYGDIDVSETTTTAGMDGAVILTIHFTSTSLALV